MALCELVKLLMKKLADERAWEIEANKTYSSVVWRLRNMSSLQLIVHFFSTSTDPVNVRVSCGVSRLVLTVEEKRVLKRFNHAWVQAHRARALAAATTGTAL